MQLHFDDVSVEDTLPTLVKRPTTTMLFRFSAVTWNAHRVHYDRPYAQTEGHAGVLVQATMHGAFLLEMVTAFAGAAGRIERFSYSNRGKAFAGDVLMLGGTVKERDAEAGAVVCALWERRQDDTICATGEARVILPRRAPAIASRRR